ATFASAAFFARLARVAASSYSAHALAVLSCASWQMARASSVSADGAYTCLVAAPEHASSARATAGAKSDAKKSAAAKRRRRRRSLPLVEQAAKVRVIGARGRKRRGSVGAPRRALLVIALRGAVGTADDRLARRGEARWQARRTPTSR